jgi:hypothetical protein
MGDSRQAKRNRGCCLGGGERDSSRKSHIGREPVCRQHERDRGAREAHVAGVSGKVSASSIAATMAIPAANGCGASNAAATPVARYDARNRRAAHPRGDVGTSRHRPPYGVPGETAAQEREGERERGRDEQSRLGAIELRDAGGETAASST